VRVQADAMNQLLRCAAQDAAPAARPSPRAAGALSVLPPAGRQSGWTSGSPARARSAADCPCSDSRFLSGASQFGARGRRSSPYTETHRGGEVDTPRPRASYPTFRRLHCASCRRCGLFRGIRTLSKERMLWTWIRLGSSCASVAPPGVASQDLTSRRSCPRAAPRRADERGRGCPTRSRIRRPCRPSTGRC
jgi:hypothetical protein